MSASKSAAVALVSGSNAAGATTTGSWIDLTAAYKASILVRVKNGATGPTAPCSARVDLSPDSGVTVYLGAGGSGWTAGVAASGEYATQFPQEEDAMYARVVFAGNTGQAVTVQSDVTKLTGI